MNSDGHIIILIGDDMLMEPDFIENHLRCHQSWPQISHACLGLIEWQKDIEVSPLMEFITKEGNCTVSATGVQGFNRSSF